MSRLKATPGPWILRTERNIEDPSWDYLPSGADGYIIIAEDDGMDRCLATILDDGDFNGLANAHLAAAAPDLYEALVNLIGAFNTPIMKRRLEGNDFALEAIQTGVKALSRARGEKE